MSRPNSAVRPPFSFGAAVTQRFGAAFAVSLFLAVPPANLAYAQTRTADFIFDRSHEMALTPAQLEGLSKEQLRLARNEIFARRGYIFSSNELRTYFAAKPWYRPATSDLNSLTLTPTEQANITLIKRFEEQAPSGQSTFPTTSAQPPALAPNDQASAASGNVAAAVRRVDCENLEATVKAQAWNAGGAPFGKPYNAWAKADFDAINKYARECTQLLQERNVPQAGLSATEIYSLLMSLQDALVRAEQQRAEEARIAEMRAKNQKWNEQKQAEATQFKARVQQLRSEGERLAAERGVDDLKLLGIGPDLIERTIIVRDYMGQPRQFMSFYQYMGYVLANAKLEKVQTRRWDLGGKTGNGFELVTKLPGRQTFGLLFTLDGSEIFPTHFVQGDNPLAFTFADLNTIFTLLETTAGIKTGDLQHFLID